MEIATRAKRAFETPQTAPYKRQVLPKLNAELGVPADPRRLAPPTDSSLPSGAPTPMPTTSATNKKTNAQIPYTRVTRDAEALGVVGTPVFVRANIGDPLTVSMPDERIDAVAGMETVNAELATQDEDENAWRVSGVLLSTESEMDPVLQDMGVRNTSTTTAILEAVQGPTQLRNLYSSRPLVGDYVYLGLLWGSNGTPGYTWKPFCSQHLDMEVLPQPPRAPQLRTPRAPQLGFAGHAKHKLLHVEFSDDDRQRLCRAVCLGRVIDSSPSPGMITVNVAIREMSIDELGRRHDEENVEYITVVDNDVENWHKPVETTRWDYRGDIGRRCPARVGAPDDDEDAYDPPDDNDVIKLADMLVDMTRTPNIDLMLRLRPVAAALAQQRPKLAESTARMVDSVVPRLLFLAEQVVIAHPSEDARAKLLQNLQTGALNLEVFFTRIEVLVPVVPAFQGLSVRRLAVARTAPGQPSRRDADAHVWLLQRAAVALGAIDALLLAGI